MRGTESSGARTRDGQRRSVCAGVGVSRGTRPRALGFGSPSGSCSEESRWLSVHPHRCGVGFVVARVDSPRLSAHATRRVARKHPAPSSRQPCRQAPDGATTICGVRPPVTRPPCSRPVRSGSYGSPCSPRRPAPERPGARLPMVELRCLMAPRAAMHLRTHVAFRIGAHRHIRARHSPCSGVLRADVDGSGDISARPVVPGG